MKRNLDITLREFLTEHFDAVNKRLDTSNGHIADHAGRLIHIETICPDHRKATADLQAEVKIIVATINKAEGVLAMIKWLRLLTGGSLLALVVLLYKVFSLAHQIGMKP